jgi:hypothetical protein
MLQLPAAVLLQAAARAVLPHQAAHLHQVVVHHLRAALHLQAAALLPAVHLQVQAVAHRVVV